MLSFSSREPPLIRSFRNLFTTQRKNTPEWVCFTLAQRRGFAHLAARPGDQFSIVQFGNEYRFYKARTPNRFALAKRLPPSNPLQSVLNRPKKDTRVGVSFLAQRRGFEPPVRFRRTHDFQSCSLNHSDISAFLDRRFFKSAYLYYTILKKNATVFAVLSKNSFKKFYFSQYYTCFI